MKTVTIYKATNIVNGKSYIGQTSKGLSYRKHQHICTTNRGSHTYFHNALRKYGKNAFDWKILEQCEINNADIKESEYIEKYNTYNHGYNLTLGGSTSRGLKVSDKTRRLQSISKKILYANKENHPRYNAIISDEQKIKTSGSNHWTHKKPFPDKAKEKIRQSMLGEKNHFYGKKHTDKAKEKQGLPHIGNQYRAKRIMVVFPDGQEKIIVNISKFCRDNGLHRGCLKKVLKGKWSHYKDHKFYYLTDKGEIIKNERYIRPKRKCKKNI